MKDTQLLQTIIDLVPQAIFWKDRNFRYLGCNKHFARLAGYSSPSEVIGKSDYELSSKEDADAFRADDEMVVKTGESIMEREEIHHQKDGKKAYLLTSKVPFHNASGELVGVLGTYADVSNLKEAEESLRENRNELARINSEMVEEMERAVRMQQQMLDSHAPDCDFLKVSIFQRPLEHITGDFYSFHYPEGGKFAFWGADIVGHGISAALYTSLLKVTAQRASPEIRENPAKFVRFLDKELNLEIQNGLLTASAFCFSRSSEGVVSFSHCCAAHPPPIIWRSETKEWSYLEKGSIAIGLFWDAERVQHSHSLKVGDRVFFYTDGFTEYSVSDGSELGSEGFLEFFEGTEQAALEKTDKTVMERLKGASPDGQIEDDLTLIGFEITA